jgi:hypothetical protein
MERPRTGVPEYERARPAAVSTEPIGGRRTGTPIVQAVTIGGSESMPILGIITQRAAAATHWTQFMVDINGRVDTASIVLPAPATPAARASLSNALTRVRFSPARDSGRPVCDQVRMQVNFSQR